MFGLVALVAFGLLVGDISRRTRRSRELEDIWQKENAEFLQRLRESR
jgi:hypothetical protein